MIKSEMTIRSIISKILKTDPTTMGYADDLVERFGMDSMQRVEIVIELEKAFDVNISDEVAVSLRSLEKILALLQKETVSQDEK